MPRLILSIFILAISLMACSSHKEVQRTETRQSEVNVEESTIDRGCTVGIGSFLASSDITASDIVIEYPMQSDSADTRASPCRIKIGQLKNTKVKSAGIRVQSESSKEGNLLVNTHNTADIAQQEESSKETHNWRIFIIGFSLCALALAIPKMLKK